MPHFDLPIQTIKNNLDKHVPILMQAYHIPGLSLAMFKGNDIILTQAYGLKNNQTKEPVTTSTVFEGASFTKPMIAYCAIKLCQQGLLSFDKPLRSYLTAPYRGDPLYLDLVTLRHILYHTSGFPEDMLAPNSTLTLGFIPGNQFCYSNAAFNYLCFVIEHIINKPLAMYLQETVLTPLQMTQSSFIWEDKYEKLAATPHNRKGEVAPKWKPKEVIGACSLHTTPSDFAKFMMATIEQAKSGSPAPSVNMLNQRIQLSTHIWAALGWQLESTDNGEVVFHAGNNVTFKSMALAYRQQAFGLVFMCNSINGYNLFEEVINLGLGEKHKPILLFEEFQLEDAKIDAVGEQTLLHWWDLYRL